jgi:hypothetical protein
VDGIRLVLCRVYNICLEPEPCWVRNHLLGHDNHTAPKRHRNGGPRLVTMIPHVTDFTSSFDEIEFTWLQNPCLEKYTTSPRQEVLPVVLGITVVNGYRCKAYGCVYYSITRKIMGNHYRANHFSYRFMPIVKRVMCSTFSGRLGTLRILVSTTRIWSSKVTQWGSIWRNKYMNRYMPTNVPYRTWHQIHPFMSRVHGSECLIGTSWLLTTSFQQVRRWTTSTKQACSRTRLARNPAWIACPWWCEHI